MAKFIWDTTECDESEISRDRIYRRLVRNGMEPGKDFIAVTYMEDSTRHDCYTILTERAMEAFSLLFTAWPDLCDEGEVLYTVYLGDEW